MRTRTVASSASLHTISPAIAALVASGMVVHSTAVAAENEDRSAWRPQVAFVQLGAAEGATAAMAGVAWEWPWSRQFKLGKVTGYWELSFGRWNSRTGNGHAWFTQLGVTPVIRLQPAGWGVGWFLEGGVGANVLAPLYRSEDKRFSTVFNFGSHMALGRRFGASREHELALRVQHFSNAGIRHPNPGENFVHLRYGRDF